MAINKEDLYFFIKKPRFAVVISAFIVILGLLSLFGLQQEKYPNIIIMADCATLEEARAAFEAGADLVGSTMNGYTAATADCKGDPNYELVKQMVAELPCPVIAEGRVHTPEQAKKMLDIGAWAVVVGGAITRPLEIAQRFMAVVR